MKVSVMIPTRDRCADLRRTCERLRALRPPPDEVLICADGCTDETSSFVRQEHPGFTLVENQVPQGSVASRDRLIRLAACEVILSLDDDSYPIGDDFLARLALVLETHPEAAVITFPELRDGGLYSAGDRTPASPGRWVSAYANCAAAMRRGVYMTLPGFPLFFDHMYEEPDYALQCYSVGSAVWFEPSLAVRHHLTQTHRKPVQRHHLNARNELWSVWMRCPWPWLPWVSLFRIWRQFRYSCTEGASWAMREPIWWTAALRGGPHCWQNRRPIPWKTYYQWMRMTRQPGSVSPVDPADAPH